MKAVQLYGAGDIRLDEKEAPTAGAGEIVIAVDACGICGSDASFFRMGSFYGAGTPMPLGHEFVGRVVETGPGAADLKPGLRIVANPMMEGAGTLGCGSLEGGAFAERVKIKALPGSRAVFPIPDSLSDDIATLCEPIAVASHAVSNAAPGKNERVVVFGAGPIGLGAVVRLRHLGISDITVIDFSDLRLSIARDLGANRTFNPSQGKTSKFLREQCGTRQSEGGSGVDVDVFIDAAGAGVALQEMIKLAPYRGRIVVVAMHTKPVEIDLAQVMSKELSIRGSIGYPEEFASVVDMVVEWNEKLRPMITHQYPLEAFHEAFAMSMKAAEAAKVVVRINKT